MTQLPSIVVAPLSAEEEEYFFPTLEHNNGPSFDEDGSGISIIRLEDRDEAEPQKPAPRNVIEIGRPLDSYAATKPAIISGFEKQMAALVVKMSQVKIHGKARINHALKSVLVEAFQSGVKYMVAETIDKANHHTHSSVYVLTGSDGTNLIATRPADTEAGKKKKAKKAKEKFETETPHQGQIVLWRDPESGRLGIPCQELSGQGRFIPFDLHESDLGSIRGPLGRRIRNAYYQGLLDLDPSLKQGKPQPGIKEIRERTRSHRNRVLKEVRTKEAADAVATEPVTIPPRKPHVPAPRKEGPLRMQEPKPKQAPEATPPVLANQIPIDKVREETEKVLEAAKKLQRKRKITLQAFAAYQKKLTELRESVGGDINKIRPKEKTLRNKRPHYVREISLIGRVTTFIEKEYKAAAKKLAQPSDLGGADTEEYAQLAQRKKVLEAAAAEARKINDALKRAIHFDRMDDEEQKHLDDTTARIKEAVRLENEARRREHAGHKKRLAALHLELKKAKESKKRRPQVTKAAQPASPAPVPAKMEPLPPALPRQTSPARPASTPEARASHPREQRWRLPKEWRRRGQGTALIQGLNTPKPH